MELVNGDCHFFMIILGYEIAKPSTQLDASWLKCSANLSRADWKSEFHFNCEIDDLVAFSSELDLFLSQQKNEVRFDPTEPEMQFEITVATDEKYNFRICSSNIYKTNSILNCKIDFQFNFRKNQMLKFDEDLKSSLQIFSSRKVVV